MTPHKTSATERDEPPAKVKLSGYVHKDRDKTYFDWYLQFAFRRDLYSTFGFMRLQSESERRQTRKCHFVAERLDFLVKEPFITIDTIRKRPEGAWFFCPSLNSFFSHWRKGPAFIGRYRDIDLLYEPFRYREFEFQRELGDFDEVAKIGIDPLQLAPDGYPPHPQRMLESKGLRLIFVDPNFSNEMIREVVTKILNRLRRPAGEKSRAPRVSFLNSADKNEIAPAHSQDTGKRRPKKLSPLYLWKTYRTLQYMDLELQLIDRRIKPITREMLGQIGFPTNKMEIDRLRHTVPGLVRKMKDDKSRLFKELEVMAYSTLSAGNFNSEELRWLKRTYGRHCVPMTQEPSSPRRLKS